MKIDSSFLFDFARNFYSDFSYCNNSGKAPMPLRYILELTHRCNLSCPFCYLGEKRKKDELSTEEWINVIKQIPFFGIITFVGGEVFIRKDFPEIFTFASKHVLGKVNITTNGTLTDENIITEFLKHKSLLVSISLDAIGEKHDKYRQREGTFEKAFNALNMIIEKKGKKKYPLTEVKSVILADNLDELPKLYKLCNELGVDFFGLSFLRTTSFRQSPDLRDNIDNTLFSERYPLKNYFDLEHFAQIYKELESMSEHSKTLLRWSPKFKPTKSLETIKYFFEHPDNDISQMYKPCKFPWSNVFINPEGIVYPCMPAIMGNVRNEKLKSIINNEKFCEFRRKLKQQKVFNPCHLCCDLYPNRV